MFLAFWAHVSYFVMDFALYLILLAVFFILLIWAVFKIYKANASEAKKKVLMAIMFGLFSLVLAFAFFEAYFRYKYDQSDGLGFLDTNVRWTARHVVFNTYGYRDRDFFVKKKPGVFRIGVVGDSLTMGYGIKNVNQRFSDILEKKLNNSGIKAEVYNLGVAGLDTCSEITQFEKVKQLNFDLIVWEYFLNDVEPCTDSAGAKILVNQKVKINPVIDFVRKQSFFFDFVYWRYSNAYLKTYAQLRTADLSQYKNQQVLKNHLSDIATFSKNLQDDTSTHKVIVMIFPFLIFLDNNYPAKDIHKMLAAKFQEQNDSVIDLLPYLLDKNKRNLMVNRFDSHPNEYVHDLAASLLYGRIVRIMASASATTK